MNRRRLLAALLAAVLLMLLPHAPLVLALVLAVETVAVAGMWTAIAAKIARDGR
jgi:hypothetical protein